MKRLTSKDRYGAVIQPDHTATTAAFAKLAKYEDTGLEPEEVEDLKKNAVKNGEWVTFTDDNGNRRQKCSVCGESVARNSQKSKYCPACGAKLVE